MEFSFRPPVIAHRGARSDAPENTLAAFLKAKQLGFQWVEFDVRLAACGELIVFHDEELNRTTNGTGRVQDFPYAFLKTLDAGSWFSPEFSGETVPTLAQVLSLLNLQGLAANIEIKGLPGDESFIVQRVLDTIQEGDVHVPLLISSFSKNILYAIRQKSSQVALGYLMDEWQPDWQLTCDQLNAIAVDINHAILNKPRVQEIKATHRFLLSYTVNDPALAKKIISWGADAVFSDYPLFLIQGPPYEHD